MKPGSRRGEEEDEGRWTSGVGGHGHDDAMDVFDGEP
jgi:hypothetical protein